MNARREQSQKAGLGRQFWRKMQKNGRPQKARTCPSPLISGGTARGGTGHISSYESFALGETRRCRNGVSQGPNADGSPKDRGFGHIDKRMNALAIEAPVLASSSHGLSDAGKFAFSQPGFHYDGCVGIRRFSPEDVPRLFEATRESIGSLCQWMVWCHAGYTMEDCAAFVSASDEKWERGESHSFVIYDVRDGTFLGSAGLNQINHAHRVANLGYWVRSSQAGRGIGTAAVRLVARFGLQELHFNRLDILIPVGNRSSQRVAQKARAKQEGILRNRLVIQGKSHDAIVYSMVAEDLEGQDGQMQPGLQLAGV
jgi:ribosomal-protein-serine acetyltransferase